MTTTSRKPRGKLDLDPVTVRKARSLARQAGRPIVPRDRIAVSRPEPGPLTNTSI